MKKPKVKVGDGVRLKRKHSGCREGVVVEVLNADLFMIETTAVKRLAVASDDFTKAPS